MLAPLTDTKAPSVENVVAGDELDVLIMHESLARKRGHAGRCRLALGVRTRDAAEIAVELLKSRDATRLRTVGWQTNDV